MNKRANVFSILLILISMYSIPMPSNALNYSRNQNLSTVGASLCGEYSGDNSGYSIASAGDVKK
jgi:hypothetical protein